jgi:hypothetical protein
MPAGSRSKVTVTSHALRQQLQGVQIPARRLTAAAEDQDVIAQLRLAENLRRQHDGAPSGDSRRSFSITLRFRMGSNLVENSSGRPPAVDHEHPAT